MAGVLVVEDLPMPEKPGDRRLAAHESAAVLSVLYGAVLVPLAMLASLALLRAERKERKNS
jgi:hypothetical protein